MLGKNLKDELIQAKAELSKSYTIFYNDGSIKKEFVKDVNDRLNKVNDQFFWIKEQFKDANDYYGRRHEIDELSLGLLVGVLYNSEDVNEDNTIKQGAKPINDMVHFYTGKSNSYLNGEKNNTEDFSEYHYRSQAYIKYSNLLNKLKENEINNNCPESFDKLVEKINSKEIFDILLSVGLVNDKSMILKRK